MAETTSSRDSFSGKTAFIISCIGSAVGLSGIWLFPYRVSQYGGAAFLIPYLFFVVVLGITGVIGEMAFGRAMGTGPMGAFSKALEMRGVKNGDKIGRVIGIIPVLGALGIAIGYAVVIGWFIKYLIEAACGTLVTQPDMAAFFGSIDPYHEDGLQQCKAHLPARQRLAQHVAAPFLKTMKSAPLWYEAGRFGCGAYTPSSCDDRLALIRIVFAACAL